MVFFLLGPACTYSIHTIWERNSRSICYKFDCLTFWVIRSLNSFLNLNYNVIFHWLERIEQMQIKRKNSETTTINGQRLKSNRIRDRDFSSQFQFSYRRLFHGPPINYSIWRSKRWITNIQKNAPGASLRLVYFQIIIFYLSLGMPCFNIDKVPWMRCIHIHIHVKWEEKYKI